MMDNDINRHKLQAIPKNKKSSTQLPIWVNKG